MKYRTLTSVVVSAAVAVGCGYHRGPDKQGGGTLQGAASGAITGGITGAQLSSTTGPGIFIGAGLGSIAGAAQGMVADSLEEDQRALGKRIYSEAEISKAQNMLAEHYSRRLEIFPTRDIYPADYFFNSDERELNNVSEALVKELTVLNKNRMPWSRLRIVNYIKSQDSTAGERTDAYATQLALDRSKALMNEFIKNGIDPRRIEAKAMIIDMPLVLDPKDHPARYNQAVEITPVDR
jgi:outer membrane protein OmpA-like peptidoglycan-associated protein